MLRYDKTASPGLVSLYDIRPGNASGPFLQPRSPHGALVTNVMEERYVIKSVSLSIHSLRFIWSSLGVPNHLVFVLPACCNSGIEPLKTFFVTEVSNLSKNRAKKQAKQPEKKILKSQSSHSSHKLVSSCNVM